MRPRRITTAISAAAAFALSVAGATGTATAALTTPHTSCLARPVVAPKVTVGSAYRSVQTSFALPGCGSLKSPPIYLSWYVYGSDGVKDVMIFNRTNGKWDFSEGRLDVYDFKYTPGTYVVRRGGGYTADYGDLPQAGTTFRVKYASAAGLTVSRRGSAVTLATNAHRYNPDTSSHTSGVGGGHVALQRKTGSTWKTIRVLTLNRQSKASYTLRNSTRQTYRAVLQEGSLYWTYATGARVK